MMNPGLSSLLVANNQDLHACQFVIRRFRTAGLTDDLVPLPMSRSDIADFLGLTIETVCRLLAKLDREDVVRLVPKGLKLMGSKERPLLFKRSYSAN
jgi:CRP-like cAMP-binding protein